MSEVNLETEQAKENFVKPCVSSSFFKSCYRIIDDDYSGYEVQKWRWWFPFWVQKNKYGCINTFSQIEDAKQWIKDGCPKEKLQKLHSKKRTVFWKNCY